jgi:hypothetical protein
MGPCSRSRDLTVESTRGGGPHIIGSGLTKASFTEPAAEKGETRYQFTAVNGNGHGVPSAAAEVKIQDVPQMRVMH